MTLSILLLTTSFVVLRRTNSGLLFLGENTILFVSDRYGASIHNKRSFLWFHVHGRVVPGFCGY